MKEDMPNIDTSGIDTLRNLKKEQDVFRERLAKMEEMKAKVSDAVYNKVRNEYAAKLEALSSEAEPLKNKIRGQYAILKGIMTELEEGLDAVRIEKEELEFRHDLGEYDDEFYENELKKWEVRQMERQAELDEAAEMAEMFLSVFDSQEDLETAPLLETLPVESRVEAAEPEIEELPEPEPLPEEEPEPLPDEEPEPLSEPEEDLLDESASEDDEEEVGETTSPLDPEDLEAVSMDDSLEDADELGVEDLMDEDHGMNVDESLSDVEDLDEDPSDLSADFNVDVSDSDLSADFGDLNNYDDDATDVDLPPTPDPSAMETQPISAQIPTMEEEVAMPPIPEQERTMLAEKLPLLPDEGDDPNGTMIISNPKIVSLNNAIEGQVIVLGMGATSIGRSPDNDLHLPEDRISRKHSQIAFGPGGYSIYDLNSENGTYVNGNRIREHFLSDGDIVMVGTYKFLYRDR